MERSDASVAAHCSTWVQEARARWPSLSLSPDEFGRHLTGLGNTSPVFAVEAYLAACCASGDAAALRVLEDEFIARVPDVVRRVDGARAFGADVAQRVRIRLLVREEGGPLPRIGRYTGQVPLSAWIRVIALRIALNAIRTAKHAGGNDDAADEVAIDDPELDYLRDRYREPFVRALGAAMAALPKDDRTLLRLHYVDGVNIDGIGRIFQVHRATVARWLVRIRAEVLAGAKELLAREIGADVDEASSVIGVLAGEIDLTLSRVLGKRTPLLPG